MTLLVQHLSVMLGDKQILKDVSFEIDTSERFGVIGASGSGKTMLALAIGGLLPEHAEVTGSIVLDGTELTALSPREQAAIRGDRIGFVFQEPKSALNPLQTLGKQITEALTIHYQLNRAQRAQAAQQLAQRAEITDAQRVLKSYPHEVSGGQRQRVAIAAAIATNPSLLIADEPTTALDVTVQEAIIQLFQQLSEEDRMSLMFITHDMAVLAQLATRAIVLDAGEIVEDGHIEQILSAPQHPLTQALISAARSEELNQGGESQ